MAPVIFTPPGKGTPNRQGLAFALLGPVRAWRDGDELDLGSPQQRMTLAVLLLEVGRSVQVSEIVDVLWGEDAPRSARGTVRTYVHRLRRVLVDASGEPVLRSDGAGYRLNIQDEQIDLGRFRASVRAADVMKADGNLGEAVSLLRDALDEWRDDALAGLPGEWAAKQRRRFERLGVQAVETLADLDLRLGGGVELLERLAAIAEREPLRERVHELWMQALYRSGRSSEALAVFENVRRTLREELGVDPGPALRELHQRILRADPALIPAPASELARAEPELAAESSLLRPAQLPVALPVFAGRGAELAELNARFREAHPPTAVVVHGTAGSGKTTFAVYWANQLASSYTDGQLYVNLRGFGSEDTVREPEEVLWELLDALGIPALNRPLGLDALTALYRSVLAERQILLMLDNVRDSAQVLPLLPGNPSCLLLITSRSALTGLVAATGAHTVEMTLLDEEQSTALMTRRLGARLMLEEPSAVRKVMFACARLPLALAVVCARAASNPSLRFSDIASQLTECDVPGLDFLAADEPTSDVRSVLSWSYKALGEPAASLFRLLGLLPLAQTNIAEAASLAGLPVARVQTLLSELADAYLVSEDRSGRFSWHDLLHEYSQELLNEVMSPEEQRTARRRLLDHHLVIASGAAKHTNGDEDAPVPLPVSPGVVATPPADFQAALDAGKAERATVLALAQFAATNGFEEHAWRLAWGMRHHLDWEGAWNEMDMVNKTVFQAAAKTKDQHGVAYALRCLARVDFHFGRRNSAYRRLDAAAQAFRAVGDRMAEGYTLRQAAGTYSYWGDDEAAFSFAQQACELFRAEQAPTGQSGALAVLARCHMKGGRYEEGLACALKARDLAGDDPPPHDWLLILSMISDIYENQGEYVRSAEFLEQQITWLLKLKDHGQTRHTLFDRMLTGCWSQLGRVLHEAGEHDRATGAQRIALERLRADLADPLLVANPYDRADSRLVTALADLDAVLADHRPTAEWYLASMITYARVVASMSEMGLVSYATPEPIGSRGDSTESNRHRTARLDLTESHHDTCVAVGGLNSQLGERAAGGQQIRRSRDQVRL
ncbi:winged helix-turn-helix domain-containing protein [Lentzea alba]